MKGIELNRGQLTLDFSYGDGLYVTDSFKHALSFARDINRESEFAAVMFEMTTVPQLIEMGLSLRNDDWEMIVKYNRSGSDGCLVRESSSGDYVRGLVSSDGNKYVVGHNKEANGFEEGKKEQFCIKLLEMQLPFTNVFPMSFLQKISPVDECKNCAKCDEGLEFGTNESLIM